ncbi:hypothetical protein D3C71_1539630 [compost metagenome]
MTACRLNGANRKLLTRSMSDGAPMMMPRSMRWSTAISMISSAVPARTVTATVGCACRMPASAGGSRLEAAIATAPTSKRANAPCRMSTASRSTASMPANALSTSGISARPWLVRCSRRFSRLNSAKPRRVSMSRNNALAAGWVMLTDAAAAVTVSSRYMARSSRSSRRLNI